MAIEVERVGATLGATVRGASLARMSEPDAHAVAAAFLAHGVLLFPGQGLDREEQVAFARRFGDLELSHHTVENLGSLGEPMVFEISNIDGQGNHIADPDHPQVRYLTGNEGWHSDSSFKAVPSTASVLSCVEAPATGGETGFADMRAAYDALPPRERDQLTGLRAWHSLEYSQAVSGVGGARPPVDPRAAAGAYHDIVHVHPETGRRSLFIGRHACAVEGMPLAQARQLLDDLLDRACRPPRVFSHRWRPGDVVVWDNRCVLHRATAWDLGERRVLRHVRVAGAAA